MRAEKIPSTPVHITYRLYGSIPNLPLQRLHDSHRLKLAQLKRSFSPHRLLEDPGAKRDLRTRTDDEAIRFYHGYDALLDGALVGPTFLATSEAKNLIIESWHTLARLRGLHIHAISVMSNHVHVILASKDDASPFYLDALLRDHKRFTGNQLNKLHRTPGRRVWAEKQYSRIVRRGKFGQVLWYVLNNPVKAGLTDDAVSWFGNWWAPELREGFIESRVA
ncbi:hypothetical protein [Lewinella sp. JB7]|uniref:hypothetical protein n=1 Tax=Lewinella sp. JB7 TaxID=2962887 RepID=UPI0020C9D284|nr:hypothetical protein [Lewinella sp. JB7]MCP9237800.1 hypothetical protein [Lewinella sp. JB7]